MISATPVRAIGEELFGVTPLGCIGVAVECDPGQGDHDGKKEKDHKDQKEIQDHKDQKEIQDHKDQKVTMDHHVLIQVTLSETDQDHKGGDDHNGGDV